MLILGIETSCDETAAAVVRDGREVLSNVIASQIDIHAETGGVVPEVAAREHMLKINYVIEKALRQGLGVRGQGLGEGMKMIDAVAVTKGPGLVSSLLIGTTAASTLALAADKPLIPVHHIQAHIMANWLEREAEEFQFPLLVLTVSGGHNEIYLMKDYGEFEMLGETLDDAAGEAFDKVARMLGLSYPGGPIISKMAEDGDAQRFDLPVVLLEKDSLDFSFSGLKTAVRNEVLSARDQGLGNREDMGGGLVKDMCASFQRVVVETFVRKVERALAKYPEVKEVHLTGGVSANKQLRAGLEKFFGELDREITFRYPANIKYCTDNAAMIAGAAYFQFQKNPENYQQWENCVADPRF